MRWTPALAILLTSCARPPVPATPCTSSPAATPDSAEASSPQLDARPGQVPPCTQPELWLALYSADDIEEPFCRTCGAQCVPDGDRLRLRWQFLGGLELFRAQSWYEPNEHFDERALPATAARNVVWLQAAAEVCRRTLSYRYASEYLDQIESWFDAARTGSQLLPDKLFVDEQPASRAQFLEFLKHGDSGMYFRFDRRTPVFAEAAPAWWRDQLGGRTLIMVSVPTGAPGISCIEVGGTDCEGYENATFFFEPGAGKLVAIDLTAAG